MFEYSPQRTKNIEMNKNDKATVCFRVQVKNFFFFFDQKCTIYTGVLTKIQKLIF